MNLYPSTIIFISSSVLNSDIYFEFSSSLSAICIKLLFVSYSFFTLLETILKASSLLSSVILFFLINLYTP